MKRISEIPNLDGMVESELADWLHDLGHGARPNIFGSGKHTIRATIELRCYGWNKLAAMKLRANGDIDSALRYECICDEIYNRLPEWAKW
jgi:hypothetical protein